ncbi:MAG: RNA-directed DNA polymerase, partial [Metamycoplasmataceae bacterium]
ITKRNYWRQFCDEIGVNIDISDMWNMIRKTGGKHMYKSIPVLTKEGRNIMTNEEKAEELVEAFVKVHSNNNISESMKVWREQILKENPNVLVRKVPSRCTLDTDFTMYELKQVLHGVKHTSPGKDEICYEMIKHLSDVSLNIILEFINKIWELGKLPISWKHGVIIPIGKPGKDHSKASNYRPISLTSNLCKVMERMIISRLNYVIEKKNLICSYQSGFRKGRNTMDSIVCLESEIRKAMVNKEVFFDVEKAYDMLWKEGLLVKLDKMGIKGKMYNWIMDFLINRTIQVRVGTSYSRTYSTDNGTPQGSVCSPVLFNIMISDIFSMIGQGFGKSLYADDGALWKRGRNVVYVESSMQKAVNEVEKWVNKWNFSLSVEKN